VLFAVAVAVGVAVAFAVSVSFPLAPFAIAGKGSSVQQ